MSLELRNPHSVLAALQTRPVDVLEIRLGSPHPSAAWQRVVEEAGRQGVPVVHSQQQRPGRQRRSAKAEEGGRQGGATALVKERRPLELSHVLQTEDLPPRGLWLALDCLQDPHNVGAVFRSASFFGVRGIVVTRDRSAPLNATVYDIAAGGLEFVPFAVVSNLAQSLKVARDNRLWVLGTSEHATLDVQDVDRQRPWLVVIGNEEKGLRRLTLDLCDDVCAIHPRGDVTSLNVSVATGCLLSILSLP